MAPYTNPGRKSKLRLDLPYRRDLRVIGSTQTNVTVGKGVHDHDAESQGQFHAVDHLAVVEGVLPVRNVFSPDCSMLRSGTGTRWM